MTSWAGPGLEGNHGRPQYQLRSLVEISFLFLYLLPRGKTCYSFPKVTEYKSLRIGISAAQDQASGNSLTSPLTNEGTDPPAKINSILKTRWQISFTVSLASHMPGYLSVFFITWIR